VFLLAAGTASAQTARLGLVAAGASGEVRVAVLDVPRGEDRFDAELRLAADPGLSLSVRRSGAAGPLGTLVLEADAELRLADAPAGRAGLRARGALGPVAARLEGAAWSAPPERFDVLAPLGRTPFARGHALGVAVDGRLNRTWLAGAEATWWRGDAGRVAWDLDASLRARRLLGAELDLTVGVQGRAAGAGEGRVGVGAGVVAVPRRAPEIAVRAWLDAVPVAGGVALRPGLESEGAWSAAEGRLSWAVRLRPGARERAPWSLGVAWRRPAGDGFWRLEGTVHAGGRAGDGVALGASWERPWSGAARR
jgi:hypothetical protein